MATQSDQIDKLINETTALLSEVVDQKNRLTTASANATAKAGESATSAQEAKTQADKATEKATESSAQAVKAKASADRAEQVTGMDTAQQLVDVAVTEAMVEVNDKIDSINPELPLVWCPLDNKLSMLAGRGEPTQIDIAGTKYDIPETHNVKFSRASSAWLDGKEYGVDEPRYTKDGKLLIEEQSTNLFKTSSNLGFNSQPLNGNFSCYGKSPVLFSDGDVVRYSFDYKCSDDNGYVRIDGSFGQGEKSVTYLVGDGEWHHAQKSFTFTGSNPMAPPVNDSFYFYAVKSMYIKNATITINEKDFSSYIPTTTTAAVTRAADIALISGDNTVTRWENKGKSVSNINKNLDGDYQLPPNKYRDLKGFNK